MSRTLYFYATRADLLQLCRDVESEEEVTYALAGNLKSNQAVCYASAVDISDLGIAQKGALLYEPSYLIVERGTPITVFTKNLSDGSELYFVGQQHNPDSIDFQPAGEHGISGVIQGAIGSVSKSKVSVKLYRLFAKMLRTCFTTIQGVYVGPKAFQLGKQGRRLTQSIKLPVDTDLTLG